MPNPKNGKCGKTTSSGQESPREPSRSQKEEDSFAESATQDRTEGAVVREADSIAESAMQDAVAEIVRENDAHAELAIQDAATERAPREEDSLVMHDAFAGQIAREQPVSEIAVVREQAELRPQQIQHSFTNSRELFGSDTQCRSTLFN